MILALKIYFIIGIIVAIYTLFEVYSKTFRETLVEKMGRELTDFEMLTVVLYHLFLWPKVAYDMLTLKKEDLDE